MCFYLTLACLRYVLWVNLRFPRSWQVEEEEEATGKGPIVVARYEDVLSARETHPTMLSVEVNVSPLPAGLDLEDYQELASSRLTDVATAAPQENSS